MIPHHVYDQLVLLVLLWLCIMLPPLWSSPSGGAPQTSTQSIKRKRSREPKPCAGLTHKPPCALGAQETSETAPAPPRRPDPRPPTHRRPRTVRPSRHFCPHTGGDDRGGLGLGNGRAKGHPHGGPWRQWPCTACAGSLPAHHGTLLHGKQAEVERIGRIRACVAEGLGMRATARVCEVAPNPVWHWRSEAAEQLTAFSASFLCDVPLQQLHLAALSAVLRAVKDGESSEAKAIKR